jgi:hypothetical protein
MKKLFLALVSTSVLSTTAAWASRPSMYCGLLDSAKIEQVRDPIRSDWILDVQAEAVLSQVAFFNPGQQLPTQDSGSQWTVKITDLRAVQTAVKLLADVPAQSSTLCVEAADYPGNAKTTIAHRVFKLWGYQNSNLVIRQNFLD